MRLLLTILSLCVFTANATTYYVSSAGSDANTGTFILPYKTATKVMSVVVAYDSILFNKGNTWNEKINIPVSNLYIGSYGTGAKPTITGLQTLIGFSNVGNVWSAIATNAVKGLNTVLYNGNIVAKGRYPNASQLPLQWDTNVGDTVINTKLTTNYVGAEIVTKSLHWIEDVSTITSQTGGSITFYPPRTYTTVNYNSFFIRNVPSVLDTAGEWCYNDATKVLSVYSLTTPNIQFSAIDTLINCVGKSYITFDGLNITGGNRTNILFDSTTNIRFINSTSNFAGLNGIAGYPAKNVTVNNDSILNSLSNGARIFGPRLTFTNNYVFKTGHLDGMGGSGNGHYNGLYCGDTAQVIMYNTFDSSGYVPINWQQGDSSIVAYNLVKNFGYNKDDGGGIYNFNGGKGSIIRHNIIYNGIGLPVIFGYGFAMSPGIYIDNGIATGTTYITIDSNTVFDCAYSCMNIGGAKYLTINDNLLINTASYPITLNHNGFTTSYFHTVKRNVFYSKSTDYESFWADSNTDLVADSNYYFRPSAPTNLIKAANTGYTLAGWQDVHGFSTPIGITAALPILKINTTTTPLSNPLAGTFISAKNIFYINGITLPPFTSSLLFKSLTELYQQYLRKLKFRKVLHK